MERIILFGIFSIPVIIFSWRSLFHVASHGFYRFFSWECIVWLLVNNYRVWFLHPFAINQLFSWVCLFYSLYLIYSGMICLRKFGKIGNNRAENTLYNFERTTLLVDQGIYKYIRHPLYASLLFLTWGIFFKNMTIPLFLVSLLSSVFLFVTAIFDEKECVVFFGDPYREYINRSKRFIPFVL